jgi:hypothetical protein
MNRSFCILSSVLLLTFFFCLQSPSAAAEPSPVPPKPEAAPAEKVVETPEMLEEKKEALSELYELLNDDEDGRFASRHAITKKQIDGKTRYFINEKAIEEMDADTLSTMTVGMDEHHAILNNEAETQRREMENMLRVIKNARNRVRQS